MRTIDSRAGLLAPALDLVDSRYGPILGISSFKLGSGQPPWWIFNARLSRPNGVHFVPYRRDAVGCSIHENDALQRVLGEALERYCLFNSEGNAELSVLPASASPFMDLLPRCSDDEHCPESLKRRSSDLQLTQTTVNVLSTGEQAWLPAGFVHVAFSPTEEELVAESISTGGAFHSSIERAIWSGLCEVAERDAVMLCWFTRRQANRVMIDKMDCPYELHERLLLLERFDLQPCLWDITTDFNLPTVLCMVSSNAYPYHVFGAACCDDPLKALTKSLDEAMMMRAIQPPFDSVSKTISYSDFQWVDRLEHHSNLYAAWQGSPALKFLLDGGNYISLSEFVSRTYWREPVSMSELVEFGKFLKDSLELTVLWSDLTMDDVKDIGVAVKVVVPEMVPLSVSHSCRWLATPRLVARANDTFNSFPHPFS